MEYPIFFRIVMQKNMEFKIFSILLMIKTALDMILSIVLIYQGYSVKGFVLATIISSVVFLFGLIYFTLIKVNIRLRLHFSINELLRFLSFGVFVSLKQIITFFSQKSDEIVLGKILTPIEHGYYYFGKDFLHKPQSIIGQSFSQVLFPLFSKIKDEKSELKKTYFTATKNVAFVAFPIFIGILFTSSLFVPIIFGMEWINSINVIRILSIAGLILVLTSNISTSLLYSVNMPQLVFKIDLIVFIVYFPLLLYVASKGIIMIAVIYAIQIILKCIVLQSFVGRYLQYNVKEYLLNIKSVVLATLIMSICLAIIDRFDMNFSNIIQLILQVVIGVIVYIITIYLLDREWLNHTLKNIVKRKPK